MKGARRLGGAAGRSNPLRSGVRAIRVHRVGGGAVRRVRDGRGGTASFPEAARALQVYLCHIQSLSSN